MSNPHETVLAALFYSKRPVRKTTHLANNAGKYKPNKTSRSHSKEFHEGSPAKKKSEEKSPYKKSGFGKKPPRKQLKDVSPIPKIHLKNSHSRNSCADSSTLKKKYASIGRLLTKSIRDFSKQKQKKEHQEIELRESRRIHQRSMQNLNAFIRDQNRKKFVKDKSNLNCRLPWGTNEARITKYVVTTIEKLNKISRPASKSRSKERRDRKQIGLGFLQNLPEKKIRRLIEKSKESLSSSSRFSSQSSSHISTLPKIVKSSQLSTRIHTQERLGERRHQPFLKNACLRPLLNSQRNIILKKL